MPAFTLRSPFLFAGDFIGDDVCFLRFDSYIPRFNSLVGQSLSHSHRAGVNSSTALAVDAVGWRIVNPSTFRRPSRRKVEDVSGVR